MADPPRHPDPEPEPGDDARAETGLESRPGMPRWVKVSLIAAAFLVVLGSFCCASAATRVAPVLAATDSAPMLLPPAS